MLYSLVSKTPEINILVSAVQALLGFGVFLRPFANTGMQPRWTIEACKEFSLIRMTSEKYPGLGG
jgi:hypothetical protein